VILPSARLDDEGVITAWEACGFDFEKEYGERGKDIVDAHHTKPLSELPKGRKTSASDLALLCANCHRVIHAARPWLTVEELRATLV
jgi:5-methylcytosine-specific restriction protein A